MTELTSSGDPCHMTCEPSRGSSVASAAFHLSGNHPSFRHLRWFRLVNSL